MGQITDLAKVVYANGPVDAPKQPPKAEIISLHALTDATLSTAINGLIIGNAVFYATRALLYADLARAAGTLGIVYADPTSAYNGVYVKVGASGTGSWSLTGLTLPSSFVADLASEANTRDAADRAEAAARLAADLAEAVTRQTNDASLSAQVANLFTAFSGYPSKASVEQAISTAEQAEEALSSVVETAEDAQASATAALNSKNAIVALAAAISPVTDTPPFSVVLGQTTVTISGGYQVGKVKYVLLEGVRISGWVATNGTTVTFPAITADDLGGQASAEMIVGIGDQTVGLDGLDQRYAVPVFPNRSAMVFASVPLTVSKLQIMDGQSSGGADIPRTTWSRMSSEPDVPAQLKFRSADRFLPNGTISSSNGGWWAVSEARPLLDMFKPGFTPQKRLDHLQSRMAAGEAVKIACFGDSTTDGQATTGWTKNPVDGNDDAVGAIDHEATALNAWPAKLKTLLRAMHGNVNIAVWNAGYTGQRLDTGWAYANFERAVISNPAYGVPDAVIVAFGLNDITGADSQVAATITETRRLCLKIMAYGSIPILMTCDPMWRNDPASRDHKEASRQIDAAKMALADELGIPVIDVASDIKNWLSRNKDGIGWRNIQTDALHFNDLGHAFKAGAIAKILFKDTVRVQSGEFRRINTFDSATSYLGAYGSRIYAGAHLAQGGNQAFTAGNIPAAGTALQDIWMWNDGSDIELVYRGLDQEQFLIAGVSDAPKVTHTNTITGVETTRVPAGVGFVSPSETYRRSDIPYRFGHLPFGLSRVRYLSPNFTNNYLGNFELWPSARSENNDCLKNTGPIRSSFSVAGAALQAVFTPAFTDGSNAWGIFSSDAVEILADLTLPTKTGFIFAHTQAWGTSGANVDGDHSFSMIYRENSTSFRLFAGREEAGVLAFASSIGTATFVTTTDDVKIRLRVRRSGDTQEIAVYEGWASEVPLLTMVRSLSEYPLHFGGFSGGLFYNGADAAADRTAVIKECRTMRVR